MAEPFNPAPPPSQDYPYFWAKPTSEPKPDISGEIRGKAIGQALDEGGAAIRDGAQSITAAYEKGIQNTIYNAVDPLRDQYMERLHSADQALQGRDTPDPLGRNAPRDVKGLPSTLDTLDSARANGKLSQTDYDARLTALAKEVRGKYPGYREYVDETFKRITGRDSANQYIKSVIGDIDSFVATRKGEGEKLYNRAISPEAMNYQGANVWAEKLKSDPDKYGPGFLSWLNENKAKDHALEMGEKTINAAKAMDSLNAEQKAKITRQGVTESGAHYYTAALDTITAHMDIDPKVNERMQDILNRDRRGESIKDVKPEEAVQLRTFLEQQWASLSSNRAADLQHHYPDLTTKEIAEIIQDEFKVQYEPFMKALGQGDFSTANTLHNVMKARNDQAALQAYNDPKWGTTLQWLAGLKEIDPQFAGAAGMQIAQQYSTEKSGEFAKAAAASVLPPDKGGKQLGETAQELRIKNQNDGRLWKSLVELHATAGVKGPRSISDENATALINSAFGPQSAHLLQYFSAESSNKGLGQQWVFDTLASNGMIDRTAKLSKEKPELYQNLESWAGSNIKFLLNKDITTAVNPRYGDVGVNYDAKSNSFFFKEPTATVKGQVQQSRDPYRTNALRSLKANMDRIVTIAEKDPTQQMDPAVKVHDILKSMNAPPGSLVFQMIRALEVAHQRPPGSDQK